MPRPPTVVCYICHREFGSASIGIHEKQCLNKWHDQNNKLPKSERQPVPARPQGFLGASNAKEGNTGGFDDSRPIKTTGQYSTTDYNAAAAQTNLVACGRCGRKFSPDRVKTHQSHCRPIPPRRNTYEARKPDVDLALLRTPLNGKSNVPRETVKPGPSQSTNSLIACKICGRTFAPDRIARHQAGCKADPLKSRSSVQKVGARRRSRASLTPLTLPIGPKCPKCSAKVTVGTKFCSNCGNSIPAMCFQCGTLFAKGAKFCSNCGSPAQANKNNNRNSGLLPAILTSNRSPSPRKIFRDHPSVVCYACALDGSVRPTGLHDSLRVKKWILRSGKLEGPRRYKTPDFTQFPNTYTAPVSPYEDVWNILHGWEKERHQMRPN